MSEADEQPEIVVEKPKRRYKKRCDFFRHALAKSPHHDAIMQKYYEMKRQHGSVNLVAFHNECVAPYVEQFDYESFRRYIRKLEQIAVKKANSVEDIKDLAPDIVDALPREDQIERKGAMPTETDLQKLKDNIMSMSEATRESIALAMNIGLGSLMDIATGKAQMSTKDKVDLFFKAMKAQDNRVSTVAKLRADNREQVAFEREFGEAAYMG